MYLYIKKKNHKIHRCHGDDYTNTNTFYFPLSVEMLTMIF